MDELSSPRPHLCFGRGTWSGLVQSFLVCVRCRRKSHRWHCAGVSSLHISLWNSKKNKALHCQSWLWVSCVLKIPQCHSAPVFSFCIWRVLQKFTPWKKILCFLLFTCNCWTDSALSVPVAHASIQIHLFSQAGKAQSDNKQRFSNARYKSVVNVLDSNCEDYLY